MEITELTPDLVGKEISCVIGGIVIPSAKIQKEGDSYYICQDLKDGNSCKNKLGYKYSWSVTSGTAEKLKTESVSRIILKGAKESGSKITLIKSSKFLKVNQNE